MQSIVQSIDQRDGAWRAALASCEVTANLQPLLALAFGPVLGQPGDLDEEISLQLII